MNIENTTNKRPYSIHAVYKIVAARNQKVGIT